MPSTPEARAALAHLLASARPVPARVGARPAPRRIILPLSGLAVVALPGGGVFGGSVRGAA